MDFLHESSAHDHLDKSPVPVLELALLLTKLLLTHEGHVEVQDGKLLALLLKRAGVGKGS